MKVKNKGITLIALIITIVVMIILAGTSIGAMVGENGIIASTRYAVFASEMEGVKENVQMKKLEILTKSYYQNVNPVLFEKKLNVNEIEIVDTLKRELLYTRAGMKEGESPEDYNAEDFKELVDEEGIVKRMYVIDKETGNGKENTYIYDEETETVFKIPATTIAGKVYHSHNNTITINNGSSGEEEDSPEPEKPEPEGNIIEKESEIVQVGEEYYYGPNFKGFNKKKTYIVYYSEDYTKTKEVILEEYLKEGEKRQIQEGSETYTFYDYGNKIWANIKTVANGQEAYWVWIPRYRYKINGKDSTPPIEVIYTDDEDKPANREKGELGEEYIVHPAFNLGEKKLKGIWISKYEPSYGESKGTNKVLAPDMSGFDRENTYIELYDIETNVFTDKKLSEVDLDTINDNNEWYDYSKQKWANIKTMANEQEAWWVWIPRYAYKIPVLNSTSHSFDIIFIDTENKPIDREEYGEELLETFQVHPAFTVGNKELQGIWMSKYEPSEK